MQHDVEAGVAAGIEAVERARRAVDRVAGAFKPVAAEATQLVLDATAGVVVTGLGKSGLVGAKLAATMASTGTPAIFVHAADALHGDAGNIRPGQVVVAISNSGETQEACAVALMARDRGVPVIAMCGCGGGSTLAGLATVVLDIGVDSEGDPYDLVPSASTVATAAMGDALAISVMVARGFGPDDFKQHHPGGALGKRLA